MLGTQETEKYAIAFLEKSENQQAVIEQLVKYHKGTWGLELAKAFFKFTVNNQYAFNKAFYGQLVLSIPEAMVPELSNLSPPDDYAKPNWVQTREYISHLISLRTQTVKVFQP